MTTTAKKKILTSPGINKGELKIKLGYKEQAFEFYTDNKGDLKIITKEGPWEPRVLIEHHPKGVNLWVSFESTLTSKYSPMYLEKLVPWADIKILWYVKTCITEPEVKAAA